MKQTIFFGAVAACLLISSCSQDELVQSTASTDEIRFSIATESQSRAAESFCASQLPGSFTLWAKTNPGSELYIPGDVVTNLSGNSYGYQGNKTRFWPKEGNLDFIAYCSDQGTFNHDLGNPVFENYKVEDNPIDQLDLIYAVRSNVSKGTGTVSLNFRHALSQVVFQATVTNPDLYVIIKGVKIGGLCNQGNYELPTESDTDETWIDPSHNDTDEDISQLPSQGVGKWKDLTGSAEYEVTAAYASYGDIISNVTVTPNHTVVISESYDDHIAGDTFSGNIQGNPWGKVLNLIPQEQTAWVPGQSTGSYIAMECEIHTSVNGEDLRLNSNDWIYIPVDIDWQQGVRYVYTIDFGNGHAGYDGGPDDENPQPTLSNISVNCKTVDDFAKLSGEIKTYTVHFVEDGVSTPGLEDIVVTDTRDRISITIPNVTPTYPYYDKLSAYYGYDVSDTSFKPSFYSWTQSYVDPTEYLETGELVSKTGRFSKNQSVEMPKWNNEWTNYLELVPVWNYGTIFTYEYHYTENFGEAEPASSFRSSNNGTNISVGCPSEVGLVRVSITDGQLMYVPDGYKIIGFSKTYDSTSKNIDITPDYEIFEATSNYLTCYVPFADCTISSTGKVTATFHAVYETVE